MKNSSTLIMMVLESKNTLLKFIKLSMYALSLASNTRDKMSNFLTGVSNDHVEECREAMLHDNIGIYL